MTDPDPQDADVETDFSLFALGGPFSRTTNPVLLLGSDFEVLAANEAGHGLTPLIHNGLPSELATALRSARGGNSARVNQLSLDDAGAYGNGRTFDVTVLPWRDRRAALLVARDVTIERERLHNLTAAHRRHTELIGLAPDEFAWETDTHGGFVFVSPQGGLGYAASELRGTTAAALALDWAAASRAFLATDPITGLDLALTRADGTVAEIATQAVPVYDDAGTWQGARGLCRDVTGIRNQARMLKRAQDRERLLLDILRIGREGGGPQAILEQAANGLLPALSADGAAVYRRTEDGFACVAKAGSPRPEAALTEVLERIAEESAPMEATGGGAAVIAQATAAQDSVNGVLCLWHADPNQGWPPDARDLIAELAAELAVAIAHLVREAELTRLSETDPLTGLSNRRALFEALTTRLPRPGRSSALLYLDLDNLKTANDTRGHAAGDEILVAVARLLRAQTRHDDIAARIGGDEFALFLDDIAADAARRRAESLVRTAAEALAGESGDPAHPLGLSVGVACTDPTHPEDAETLLNRADAAMYRAKQSGKSRAVEAEAAGQRGEPERA